MRNHCEACGEPIALEDELCYDCAMENAAVELSIRQKERPWRLRPSAHKERDEQFGEGAI